MSTSRFIGAQTAQVTCLLLSLMLAIDDGPNPSAAAETPDIKPSSANPTNTHKFPVAPGVQPPGPDAPPPLAAPFDAKQARAAQKSWAKYLGLNEEPKNSLGMELAIIPPGKYTMGSTPQENNLGRKLARDAKIRFDAWEWQRLGDEVPAHQVTIIRPFLLGAHEVTVGQFKKFVQAVNYLTEAEQFALNNPRTPNPDDKIQRKTLTWHEPGYVTADDMPVTLVNWMDAVHFCNWLSNREKLKPCYQQDPETGWNLVASGTGYRLPTEAEWEYACRAGTATQFYFGDDPAKLDEFGWFETNSGGKPRAVGQKVSNAFGLYDMHGGACEWCHDWFDAKWYSKTSPDMPNGPAFASYHVFRGGGWSTNVVGCRSAFRSFYAPIVQRNVNGFRVLCVK